MKITILAVLTILTLSLAGASAQAQIVNSTLQGNDYNFVQGGGG